MIFEANALSKRFGYHSALTNVSIKLHGGEVHALIGENGAGKSTLMNIACGKLRPDSGTISVDGRAVSFNAPLDAQRAGIVMAPQELTLCPHLSVAENIMLGSHRIGWRGIDWRKTRRIAAERLGELDDSIDLDLPVGRLRAAQQQLVQIARATATDAWALVFDEPTATLSLQEAGKLEQFIRAFCRKGGAIFYISHRLKEIMDLADRITVLRDGTKVAELDPATTNPDEMIQHMAGRTASSRRAAGRNRFPRGGQTVLKVTGLTRAGEFRNIGFELRRGEILGVSGLIGSGRTELAKCIFGATVADTGSVEINGRQVRYKHPAEAIADGLVYLPEERKKEGLFGLLSVSENIGIASLRKLNGPLGISWLKVASTARTFLDQLQIRAPSLSAPVKTLSGGNQQKVIIARWLLAKCNILLLDEPMRGIDVNARSEIQQVLRQLTEQGLSILYISSELQEMQDISDRILIMHEGEQKGLIEAADVSQEELLRIAVS